MSLEVKNSNFTHLHLHSVYSLLDGAIKIPELIQHVKKLGMKSVAVTDHGNMFATVDFYEEAKKHHIKPIIGCEFYVAPGSRTHKKVVEKLPDGQNYHLILLAKNKQGYQNLIKLASKAYTEGFYRKPRIDYELLSQHTKGLVGLTACLAGEVNRKIYQGEQQKALELSGFLNEIFEKDSFYLEVMNHKIHEQQLVTKGAIDIHKRTQIPMVLTNDSHFLLKEDREVQDLMLRMQMGKRIDDPMEFGFNEEFYVKSPKEMQQVLPELPHAYLNTQKIDEMIDLNLDFGHPLLPNFDIPKDKTIAAYFQDLTHKGLKKKFNNNEIPKKYIDRLKYEVQVIQKMGYEGYFLIVHDFICFAKEKNIFVGPGRGSAAGSLVAYALEITNVDPLCYNLLFERFLNPSRNEMPDIDIDFCRDRREEVIQYVIQKYGKDHVGQIITFGTLSAKAVIKDVSRVLNYDFQEINQLSKQLPDTPGIKLEDAIENDPEIKKYFKDHQELLHYAKALEGNPKNIGKHAAGVVIAPQPLDEIIPLAIDTKIEKGATISQFEKGNLEKVGLVKMDFLGLKNLTVIEQALNSIKKRLNIQLDINSIPLDDADTYKLLQSGSTKGVFQLESSGITTLIQKAIPKNFEDIVACIALYRPGPLQSGMAEEYIKRKNGEVRVSYSHPSLEPILKETFGTIIYQEQVMLISQVVGGFSMSDADTLRKAMGKKKLDVMNKMKQSFIQGAIKKKYEHKFANNLFETMSKFGEYGFNKSHSVAYGLITYYTAYLKTHYPIDFIKSNLDAEIEDTDKLMSFIHSCKDMGIKVLSPDINESLELFNIIDSHTIRYGLLGIKGLGKDAVSHIVSTRGNIKFIDIHDLIDRIFIKYLNKKVLESLIFSGSLDSLGFSRAAYYDSIESTLQWASKYHADKDVGQTNLFETVQRFEITDKADWPSAKKIQLEKTALGLYLTAHPLDEYQTILNQTEIINITDLDDGISTDKKVTISGIIEKVKNVTSKRGSNFIEIQVSDTTGSTQIRVYPKLHEPFKELLKENQILIIKCKVTVYRDSDPPAMFVSAIHIQDINQLTNFIPKKLHLNLMSLSTNSISTQIERLKKILMHHKGDFPVLIHYIDSNTVKSVMKVHPLFYVNDNHKLTQDLLPIVKNQKNIAWEVGSKVYVNSQAIAI